jgi:AcrR family transcriptional regulator
MKKQENDRRSLRTRKLLRDALNTLMREKRYDKITVQDIIDQANVGRSTFYAHFQDKEDLLVSGFEQALDLFNQHLQLGEGKKHPSMSVVGMFHHAQEFLPVYEALMWGRGIEFIYQQGQAYLSRRIEADLVAQLPGGEQPAVPTSILANHIAGTLITLLKWWLDNKIPYSPERMDEIFHQLVMPTVQAVMPVHLRGSTRG